MKHIEKGVSMKKLIIILCLLLSACSEAEVPLPIDDEKKEVEKIIPTKPNVSEETEDVVSTDTDVHDIDERASLIKSEADQRAIDMYDEMTSTRFDNAVFTAFYADEQIQMQIFETNQIANFFSILKNAKITSLSNTRKSSDNDLRIDVIASNSMNQHVHCKFVFNEEDPYLILLDSANEYHITFENSMTDTMYDYFDFMKLGTNVAASEAEIYEKQFISEADITEEYDKMNYLLKESINSADGLIRKSYGDWYSLDESNLHRILALLFYTGEYQQAPAFDEAIFRFIMLNHESMNIIGGDVEALTEISYLKNGIERTLTLDTAIAGYSILMSGKDFRAAYQRLFNTEMNWDESRSYHAGPLGRDGYGYFAEHDLYYFARYCIGAFGGYSGWNLLIEEMEETNDILNVKLLNFYTNYDWVENNNYIRIYDKDWQEVLVKDIEWEEKSALKDVVLPMRNRFQQWKVQLLHREDGGYSLLSTQCLNSSEAEVTEGSFVKIVKRHPFNVLSSSNYLMPQFTLLGQNAFLINAEISMLSDEVRGFIVEEDEQQVIIKAVDRYMLPFKDQYIYYIKQIFTYDKGQNAFVNAEKILAKNQYFLD